MAYALENSSKLSGSKPKNVLHKLSSSGRLKSKNKHELHRQISFSKFVDSQKDNNKKIG